MAAPLIDLKLDSYSGVETLGSIVTSRSIFIHRPLLWHGRETITANYLSIGTLANTGLIVFIFFLLWAMYVLYKSAIAIQTRCTRSTIKGYLFAFIVLQSVSGFAYAYSFFWIIFGALMGFSSNTKPLFHQREGGAQSV